MFVNRRACEGDGVGVEGSVGVKTWHPACARG
jgi:hypothetical protein